MQAKRSKKIQEIATASSATARTTVEGAGQVVKITDDLNTLSAELNRQVQLFKIRKDQAPVLKTQSQEQAQA